MALVSVRALSLIFQWVYILSAFLSFVFFAYQKTKKRCKWEVLYVSSVRPQTLRTNAIKTFFGVHPKPARSRVVSVFALEPDGPTV